MIHPQHIADVIEQLARTFLRGGQIFFLLRGN